MYRRHSLASYVINFQSQWNNVKLGGSKIIFPNGWENMNYYKTFMTGEEICKTHVEIPELFLEFVCLYRRELGGSKNLVIFFKYKILSLLF